MLVLTLLMPKTVYSQVVDTSHRIDTLSNSDRLSVRTNALDWLLLVPNIGIEYDLKNVNYNRWSVGLNLRYNWQTSHTFKPGVVYNVAEARLEVRSYYRIREFSNYIERKKKFWDRFLSPRREKSKHPTTTYYRGGFLAYNKFSIKLGDEGNQGNAIIGGVMFGLVRPLYEFRNGHSLDFELGAAVGVGERTGTGEAVQTGGSMTMGMAVAAAAGRAGALSSGDKASIWASGPQAANRLRTSSAPSRIRKERRIICPPPPVTGSWLRQRTRVERWFRWAAGRRPPCRGSPARRRAVPRRRGTWPGL